MLQSVTIANITASPDQYTMKFTTTTPAVDAGFGEMLGSTVTYYSRASINPKTSSFNVGDVIQINMDMLDIVEKPFLKPATNDEPAKIIQLKWLYAKK